MTFIQKLVNYFRSGYPCVAITTAEEQRAQGDVVAAAKETKREVMTWSAAEGLVSVSTSQRWSELEDLLAALREWQKMNRSDTVFVLRDVHQWNFANDPVMARYLREVITDAPGRGCTIVLIAPEFKPYSAIEKLVTLVEYSLPSSDELKKIAAGIQESVTKKIKRASDDVIRALGGLSTTEAENALALSVIETGEFSAEIIYREKVAAVKRSGLLEIVDPDPQGLEAIGGLENLKQWIMKRKKAYSDEAAKYGLPSPKGVLLAGVPGTGKSLSAKAFGTALGIPTLKLDIGALFNSLVGESEARTREALQLAEAMSPCVTGDTTITLADGSLLPIIDLYRQFDPASPLDVMCWNERMGLVDQTRVQAVTKRRADTFKIRCALGFSITSTGNHPHLVMRGSFPKWVATDDIKIGDMIAVPTAGLNGDEDAIRFWPDGIREVDGELRKGRGGFMDSKIPKLPTILTSELAWLIAVVSDGDGFLSQNGRIGFTSTKKELLDFFDGVCEAAFGVYPKRILTHPAGTVTIKGSGETITSTQDFYTSYFHSKLAQEFIRDAWIHALSFPLSARKAAIAGLLDSDGTIEEDRISLAICTDVERRVAQARALFLSVGVIPASYSYRHLFVCGAEAVKLATIASPFLQHQSKQEICAMLAKRDALFTRGTGFNCGELLQDARKKSGLSHSQIGVSTSETYAFEQKRRHIPERKLQNYIDRLRSDELQKLLDYQCRWVSVESITPEGEQDVYDLVCSGDDTRSFIANSMITHNCVLWCDEVDKGLAGAGGSGANDSGVTRRVFGTLLSWMQEKKKPVFLVMTANQVDSLPPEFLRRGRFDELFAIDLPHAGEREQIANVVLKRVKRDPKKFDISKIAQATEAFTGAEIEAVVTEALFAAFDNDREVETSDIVTAASTMIPISKMMSEKIDAIRRWGEGRARAASIAPQAAAQTTRKIKV